MQSLPILTFRNHAVRNDWFHDKLCFVKIIEWRIYRCLNFCWIFKPTNTWNVAFYDALVSLRPINESALIIPATFSFYENNARRLCQSIIFSRRWTTQLLKHSVTSWNGVCSRSKGEYRLLSFLHAARINCQQMSENYF